MNGVTYNPNYERKVDKSCIPTCNILGVDIAAINMGWLLNFLISNIHDLKGDYVCVSNVHTTVSAYEDPHYRRIQNGGILAIPDGGPLSTVGRRRGYINMRRTTGPDLMDEIFRVSLERGYRHYFLGSTEETLKKLRLELEQRYPGLQITGMCSPPFRELSKQEDDAIVCSINRSHADFVWVGLGAPKQEKWMAGHQGRIESLMIGVGAGFDYFSGNIKRAPSWMQRLNLEWLYRLLQEPRRLFKRYAHTNSKFIIEAILRKR